MIEFIHPEDAAALEALKKIPVLPAVTKSFMDHGVGQLQAGLNMAIKVWLYPIQIPHPIGVDDIPLDGDLGKLQDVD